MAVEYQKCSEAEAQLWTPLLPKVSRLIWSYLSFHLHLGMEVFTTATAVDNNSDDDDNNNNSSQYVYIYRSVTVDQIIFSAF